MARLLVAIGIAIALVGAILWLFPRAFAWFGNLPGDLRIEWGRTEIFVPLTSMIVVSVVLTLVLDLLARLFDGGG